MKIFPILAEIGPQSGVFWDYSRPPDGIVAAILFFLLLMCIGVALDVALCVYFLKRPARPSEWGSMLATRSMSGRMVLILSLVLTMGYIGFSVGYSLFFPDVVEVEPVTLLAQGFFFHIPAMMILFGVFLYRRLAAHAPVGPALRNTPAMLGISVLLYIAAVPVLWFYSLIYQAFLHQLGCNLYLQEVAEIFLAPAPTWHRVGMYVVAIVLAPVVEECFFRGVLFPWVIRRAGFWPAVASVSLLFAAIHLHLPSFFPLLLLSAMFCVVYARTRSLLVPIGMHACFNGVSLLLLALTGG